MSTSVELEERPPSVTVEDVRDAPRMPSATRREKLKKLYFGIQSCFHVPLLVPFFLTNQRDVIAADAEAWNNVLKLNITSPLGRQLWFLANYPEYRNLYHYRIRRGNLLAEITLMVLLVIYRECPSLFLYCPDVGPGLFIQHGFSTIVIARHIGKNCWINQQVTVGYRHGPEGCPTIGDNVTICAGAKVLGDITVGNNAAVGANAVVIKDVPDNCVVVGVPAHVVKINGVRVT